MTLRKWITPRFNKRFRKCIGIFSALAVFGTGVGIWLLADKMVTPRRMLIQDWQRKILNEPAEYGIAVDPFQVIASDGTKLEAILVMPHETPGTAKKRFGMGNRLHASGHGTENCGLVLLLHGRSGMKENALPITERFVAAGFTCVIFDARAHGQSEGRFCTFGQCEVDDALTVLEAARDREGIDSTAPTFGFGYSLGAAVLVQTLAKTDKIKAAATIAPFCDLEELVVYSSGKYSAGHLPHWMAKSVVRLGELRGGFRSQNLNPLTAATPIAVPTFVIHGKLDGVIPVDHGRQVFVAIPNENKRWREFDHATHGNIWLEGGDDLYQEILEFYLSTIQ